MQDVNTDIILKEWCAKIPRGFPLVENGEFTDKKDLEILKKLVGESIFSSVMSLFKNGIGVVKKFISRMISKKMGNLQQGEVTKITIPGSGKYNLFERSSGHLAHISGNLSEALVCELLIEKNKNKIEDPSLPIPITVVDLNKDGLSKVESVKRAVSTFDDKLKMEEPEKYESIKKHITDRSLEMTNHLINEMIKNKGVITSVYIDNLAFTRGKDDKTDIVLEVIKEDAVLLHKYSLKLYKTRNISLTNPTAITLVQKLLGDDAGEELSKILKSDRILKKSIPASRDISKMIKSEPDAKIKSDLEAKRTSIRNPINQRVAERTFNYLRPKFNKNKKLVLDNLLKLLGVEGDAKPLMSITDKLGSSVVTRYPDLDLSNVKVVRNGATINFYNTKNKKIITSFSFKEGEFKKVSGKVVIPQNKKGE